MSDPFVESLASLAERSVHKAAAEAAQSAPASSSSDAMSDADGASASVSRAQARDLAYLQAHVDQYRQRIESVLTYLDDLRFARAASGDSQQSAALRHRTPAQLQADVRSLESEWSTWLLLMELRRADDARSLPPMPPSLSERYSSEQLAQRLATAPGGSVGRVLRIVNWLEELAVFLLRVDESGGGGVSLRASLRRLQRSGVGDAQRDWLDPDVDLRLKAAGLLPPGSSVLERQDVEEEQRMLEAVWQLIRAGRITDAVQLCRTYQQHWRAASLQGGELWHDDGQLQPDGTVFRVGNPNRQLWRFTCRKLSQAVGVSPVESSIYGLLGGDLPSALKYSGQYRYDDALFCHLKLLVDQQIDNFIAAEGKQEAMAERIPKPEVRRETNQRPLPPNSDLSSILTSLESPLNPLVTASVSAHATQNPYTRLQKWLMLDDVERAEQEMVHTIQTQWKADKPANAEYALNDTYLLFAFHLYLYLHPACPHGESLNAAGSYVLHALLSYLESDSRLHPLIASYSQYLSAEQRVSFYIRFLHRVPSLAARQQRLAELAQFHPENSLEVTTGLVQNIIGAEAPEVAAPALTLSPGKAELGLLPLPSAVSVPSGSGGAGVVSLTNLLASPDGSVLAVTPADMDKMVSIDCFALSGPSVEYEVVQQALAHATQLYRSFVARDKLAAAKRFAQHLTDKMWEHHIFASMQQQQQKGQPLSSLWVALDREYGHWRLFIKCCNWYETWLTQAAMRPHLDQFDPTQYSNAAQAQREYQKFAKKWAQYQQELAEWKEAQNSTVDSCVASLLELLESDGGWLTPLEGSPRPADLLELRRICIPRIAAMYMQICTESEQHHRCFALAEVLAAPQHRLHSCFTSAQLRALLQQLRMAWIKSELPEREQAEDSVSDAEGVGMQQEAMQA